MQLRFVQSRMVWLVGLLVMAAPLISRGQVPFINPGVTAFEPQISVVNSGALQDVQGTVSADRKYVTIGARPQNSQLLQLRDFSFQTPVGAGPVGGVTPGATPPVAAGLINPPVALGAGAGSVLSRRGMTRIVSTTAPRPAR